MITSECFEASSDSFVPVVSIISEEDNLGAAVTMLQMFLVPQGSCSDGSVISVIGTLSSFSFNVCISEFVGYKLNKLSIIYLALIDAIHKFHF